MTAPSITSYFRRAVSRMWSTLAAFKPPPRIKISVWAETNRVLSPEDSARTGRWKAFAYQTEIMDACLEPGVEDVSVWGSAQWGKTQIKLNIMGYFIHHDPAPMMDVEPTLEMARTFSKDRFDPMVRDTQCLTPLVAAIDDKKKKGNATLHKKYPGGQLTISGSNSPASLAARPVRILLGDDIDRFKITSEGDSWMLALKRTTAFWNRLRVTFTTPTVKGSSRGEIRWNNSDQRVYMVPCIHCGHPQRLMWSGIKYELAIDGTVKNVWYECERCKGKMTERDKMRMVNGGNWIKQNPKVTKHAGFHINELYSPLSTWKKIVTDFLDARKDTETLRVWVNTVLGELWEETDNLGLSAASFMDRIEEYEILPNDILVVTAAVDIQENRVELIFEGWGEDEQNWHIHRQTIPGNFARTSVQRDLAHALDRKFKHASGIDMSADLVIVDTGYLAQTAYKFIKAQQSVRRIVAVKGYGGPGKKLMHKVQQEKKIRVTLIIAGVDEAKEIIYDRLMIDEPGAAYIHFNQQCDNEYFTQLTSERRRTKYKYGHAVKVWEKDRSARNEVLDLKVYNLVAMRFLNVNWSAQRKYIDKLAGALNATNDTDGDDRTPPKPKQTTTRRTNSFLNRY